MAFLKEEREEIKEEKEISFFCKRYRVLLEGTASNLSSTERRLRKKGHNEVDIEKNTNFRVDEIKYVLEVCCDSCCTENGNCSYKKADKKPWEVAVNYLERAIIKNEN